MMLLGWTTYLQMHRIGPKSVWEGLKKWIGEYGKAVGVDRNVGASFRSWSECKGTGFKRGPESWRDKLSKLTIKKTFFCFHTTNSVFFFEFCIPQKWGGGGKHTPPHFSDMEHVQPRLIYDNRLPYMSSCEIYLSTLS